VVIETLAGLTGQSANAEDFGQNPRMPAYGLFPADQFVITNGSCADCDTLPQARWFFRGETIAVPKNAELLAGFARGLSVYDDLAAWAKATPIGSAMAYPPLVWVGSRDFVRDVQLSADGRTIKTASGERALQLVPKLPLNGSYFDSSSVAYFHGQPLKIRGNQQGDSFVARTFWPQRFRLPENPASVALSADPAALRNWIRSQPKGGAQSPFSVESVWRHPGSSGPRIGQPVLGLMLNGAQGDDDEAHGGHFALMTGRVGAQGAMDEWLVNNFYTLDSESEKGIIAAPVPLDNYLGDLNSGQAWYRPSYLLVATLKDGRTAVRLQSALSRVYNQFYRHQFAYQHASANCAGISVMTSRTLGWQVPERGPESWLKAVIGLPLVAIKNKSLRKGKGTFDYLTEDQTRLYPAAAFEEMGVLAYIVRRLLYAMPILIGVNLITFALFFVVNTPDDMARMQLGVKRVTPEAIEPSWKAERGYDKPLFINAELRGGRGVLTDTIFFSKSARMFVGDFGAPRTAATSPAKSPRAWGRRWPSRCRPSFSAVRDGQLCAAAGLLPRHAFDFWGVVLCVAMMSISGLFYIIGGQYLISKLWRLVPISGYSDGLDAWKFLILPVLIGVVSGIGSSTRWYRTIFLEEIGKDYVRTARAKGLAGNRRALPPRAAQRDDSDPDRRRRGHSAAVHGLAAHRILLRHSRAGQLHHRRDQRAGFRRGARDGLHRLGALHRRPDPDRHFLHPGRSADTLRLMTFFPVVLWSDVLIWLLVVGRRSALGVLVAQSAAARGLAAGRAQPGRDGGGDGAARLRRWSACSIRCITGHAGGQARAAGAYAVEVLSLLDALLTPLRTRNEKTYSEPLATRAYAKESIEVRDADGGVHRCAISAPEVWRRASWASARKTSRRRRCRPLRRAGRWAACLVSGCGCWRPCAAAWLARARAWRCAQGVARRLAWRDGVCLECGADHARRAAADRRAAGALASITTSSAPTRSGRTCSTRSSRACAPRWSSALVTTLVMLPLAIAARHRRRLFPRLGR
jgi:hypothetical protein